MSVLFGSSKKKKAKKAAKKEEEDKAKAEAEKQAAIDRGDPIIGKASAKAQAAHAKRFGNVINTLLGGGRQGFGTTGANYSGALNPGAPLSSTAAVGSLLSSAVSGGLTPVQIGAGAQIGGGSAGFDPRTNKNR